MLNNGAIKTVVALLPAIVAFFVSYISNDAFPISILLLLIGGVLSAIFLTKGLRANSGLFVSILVFLFVIIGYVATFGFTGCLAIARLGAL